MAAWSLQSAPGQTDLVLIPRHGHLDTLWARGAAGEVFPVIRDGVEWRPDTRGPANARDA